MIAHTFAPLWLSEMNYEEMFVFRNLRQQYNVASNHVCVLCVCVEPGAVTQSQWADQNRAERRRDCAELHPIP